ncbi:MAG TPA: cysteine synthase family protein [Chloroflexota bacterium]|nr:cysteine synthase family protein [Chloroflexota bacterium]
MTDWARRRSVYDSILDTAGLTPMVRIRQLAKDVPAEILMKVEYFSPSGSVKDRILPRLVRAAESRGDLRHGMSIIEGTTGNTGIATSMVGAALGYQVVIVMPSGMSDERKKAIQAYGAQLILTPGGESDVDLVLDKVRDLKQDAPGKYWEVGQFDNADNVEAHYETTGPELWEQCEGSLDAFVASQGTGGTLTGVGRYLKEQSSCVQVYAVEPAECPILAGGGWGPHLIEGIGDGFVPANLHLELLDGVIEVASEEAVEMARRLAREEGIFCGISSGCNLVAAKKLSLANPQMRKICTMVNDNGLRYLSTELTGETVKLDVPDRSHDLSAEDRRKLAAHPLAVIR